MKYNPHVHRGECRTDMTVSQHSRKAASLSTIICHQHLGVDYFSCCFLLLSLKYKVLKQGQQNMSLFSEISHLKLCYIDCFRKKQKIKVVKPTLPSFSHYQVLSLSQNYFYINKSNQHPNCPGILLTLYNYSFFPSQQ